MHKLRNVSLMAATLLLGAVPYFASAKTYTKIEVLNIYYRVKLSTGYDLNSHTCDFDFSTSDLEVYIANAYDNGLIDDAWVRYLDHKYKNLTGEIKSKNKKYYQITLSSNSNQATSEYGRMVFKFDIKKKNPYATAHGNAKVKRQASNNFEACSSKATF